MSDSLAERIQRPSAKRRILIAGVGALMPSVALLVTIDAAQMLESFSEVALAAYGIRTLALFILGGWMGYMAEDAHRAQSLFQIGVAAPALVLAMVQADNAARGLEAIPQGLFVPVVQAFADPPDIYRFTWSKRTMGEQIEQGLRGGVYEDPRSYFVYIHKVVSVETARQLRDEARKEKAFSRARVYVSERHGVRVYYVVVAWHKAKAEAEALLRWVYVKGFTMGGLYNLRE
jgi:hypothetical protein